MEKVSNLEDIPNNTQSRSQDQNPTGLQLAQGREKLGQGRRVKFGAKLSQGRD